MVIGVSVKKSGIDFFGQHSFIILQNPINPLSDIMLDASGHYLNDKHSRDVLTGDSVYPQTISISGYVNYWKGEKEYLYIFEMDLSKNQSEKVKNLIIKEDSSRTWLTCTEKASRVLIGSGLFKGIKQTSHPKKLLSQLLGYFEENDLPVKKYDLENGEEIKQESKKNEAKSLDD